MNAGPFPAFDRQIEKLRPFARQLRYLSSFFDQVR
jgi:hypothetical protein